MDDKESIHKEVEKLVCLFQTAAHIAAEMIANGQLSFDDWFDEVKKYDAGGSFFDSLRLQTRSIWIWNSLRRDPGLQQFFESLSPAGVRWNRDSDPMLVIKRNDWFVIAFQGGSCLSANAKPPSQEPAAFVLLDDLFMRPGRNDRLECCDCRCLLHLRPEDIYPIEREIDILRVDREQIIELDEGLIKIEVPSINQAYTVASRRLEPDRRTHGGNVYEHVVHVGNAARNRLEAIRLSVELGEWPLPTDRSQSSYQYPLFPDDSN